MPGKRQPSVLFSVVVEDSACFDPQDWVNELTPTQRGILIRETGEPLSDAPWLLAQLEEISKLALEEERLNAIEELLGWEDPGVGGWCEWHCPFCPRRAILSRRID